MIGKDSNDKAGNECNLNEKPNPQGQIVAARTHEKVKEQCKQPSHSAVQ